MYTQSIGTVINAAMAQWQGVGSPSVIVLPSGSSGIQLGFGESSAVKFLVNVEDPHEGPESDGNAGFSEGGFNDQTLFEDIVTGAMVTRSNYWALGQGGGHPREYFRTPACDQR